MMDEIVEFMFALPRSMQEIIRPRPESDFEPPRRKDASIKTIDLLRVLAS